LAHSVAAFAADIPGSTFTT